MAIQTRNTAENYSKNTKKLGFGTNLDKKIEIRVGNNLLPPFPHQKNQKVFDPVLLSQKPFCKKYIFLACKKGLPVN